MQEKRKTQRWPAYLGARATFLPHQSTSDCLIRNTSGTGARLRIERGQFVPDEFELTIPTRDTVYRALARWRGYDEVGVELMPVSGNMDMTDQPSIMERLKKAEKKNRKLKLRLAELTQ